MIGEPVTGDMEVQFLKLKDIVTSKVDNFYFSREQYFGPVRPTAIISFGSKIIRLNALVLAEAVPTFYLPLALKQNLYDAVIVHLDEHFEFQSYNPEERALGELNALIGNPDYSYDGTIEQAKDYFMRMHWAFDIRYQKKNPYN